MRWVPEYDVEYLVEALPGVSRVLVDHHSQDHSNHSEDQVLNDTNEEALHVSICLTELSHFTIAQRSFMGLY